MSESAAYSYVHVGFVLSTYRRTSIAQPRFDVEVAMNKEPQLRYGVFSEGMDSYLHELPRGGCPYPLGSTEREAWLGGWDQAEYGKRYSHSELSLRERIRVQRSTREERQACVCRRH
ncbi:MAG: Rmf/CrpP family protein [Acetobacteraceae bacterium]|jgi:ribosome modulation factor